MIGVRHSRASPHASCQVSRQCCAEMPTLLGSQLLDLSSDAVQLPDEVDGRGGDHAHVGGVQATSTKRALGSCPLRHCADSSRSSAPIRWRLAMHRVPRPPTLQPQAPAPGSPTASVKTEGPAQCAAHPLRRRSPSALECAGVRPPRARPARGQSIRPCPPAGGTNAPVCPFERLPASASRRSCQRERSFCASHNSWGSSSLRQSKAKNLGSIGPMDTNCPSDVRYVV